MDFFSRITALTLIIVLSPFLLTISLLNFLFHGNPIIFKQIRVGKNFKQFNILKFRTLKNVNGPSNLFSKKKKLDTSKWGLFLRRTKLDELPQLFNIVKGDMRFIGPRPEIPEYVDNDLFDFLEKIKPGLSGYSSILFRNESEIFPMIESENPYDDILKIKILLDKYYLNKKGFFEDLKLVFFTILSIIYPEKTGHYLLIKLLSIREQSLLLSLDNRSSSLDYDFDNLANRLSFLLSSYESQQMSNSKIKPEIKV